MNPTRRQFLTFALPAAAVAAAGCSSSSDTGQHLDTKPPPPAGPLKPREAPAPAGATPKK